MPGVKVNRQAAGDPRERSRDGRPGLARLAPAQAAATLCVGTPQVHCKACSRQCGPRYHSSSRSETGVGEASAPTRRARHS